MIFGTGNPNPDFDGRVRAGDNLYTCSVVALDVETGKLRWYFQEVKHDLWDYDQAAPPLLFDVQQAGKRIPAVGAAGKTGWFYVLDRQTGKSLLPTIEKEVGQNPGQATSRTQTFLTTPSFSEQRNLFSPLTVNDVTTAPGVFGGSGWSPVSYSPTTGLAYVEAVESPMIFHTSDTGEPGPRDMVLGGGFSVPKDQMATGALVAIDVNSGLTRWRTPSVPFLWGFYRNGGESCVCRRIRWTL